MSTVPQYRATILDPRAPDAAAALAALRVDPAIEWLDTFDEQLRGYREHRPVDDDDATIDAVFAHYPWARRVVRLLPEAAFVALRTRRNQLKITRDEQARLRRKTVGVIGLSVGQSVAFTLALERSCGALRLADFDTIELSNLNRLRCGVQHLGVNKAIVAAREIAELDPYLHVTCFTRGYCDADAETFLNGLDLVVEECDSLDVKVAVREAARACRIPVVMNTSDRGMTDIERFDLEPDRAFFHGRVALPDASTLAQLDTAHKIPFVMDILGADSISPRLRASLVEIGRSISTWPQLGADVTLGGAIVTDVARRILLGEAVASGRYYADLAEIGRA